MEALNGPLNGPLADHQFVTDGGLETDLLFHRGVDLPEFAAYPLVGTDAGRRVLVDYYDAYADIARRAGVALVLETPTWRASPRWAERLGHSPEQLRRLNHAAVALMREIRARHDDVEHVVVSGAVGPRGDGYRPDSSFTAQEAEDYHLTQVSALAEAGVDLVSAYTLTSVAEAVGVVRAARTSGVPVSIAFTVETDGRLPDGTPLGEAVTTVDELAPPDHFQINCAHPTHVGRAFSSGDDGSWRTRIVGILANASTQSHAELDEAPELDEGDPEAFAADHDRFAQHLPALTVRGGCCGTDARHVAALWGLAG